MIIPKLDEFFLDYFKAKVVLGQGNRRSPSRDPEFPDVFLLGGKGMDSHFSVEGKLLRVDVAMDTRDMEKVGQFQEFVRLQQGGFREYMVDGVYTGCAAYLTGKRGYSFRLYRKDIESPDLYDKPTWRCEAELMARFMDVQKLVRVREWDYPGALVEALRMLSERFPQSLYSNPSIGMPERAPVRSWQVEFNVPERYLNSYRASFSAWESWLLCYGVSEVNRSLRGLNECMKVPVRRGIYIVVESACYRNISRFFAKRVVGQSLGDDRYLIAFRV